MLMVSHDRFFISQTANTILAIEDGELVVYDGDYKSYLEQQGGVAEQVARQRHLIVGVLVHEHQPLALGEEELEILELTTRRVDH